MILCYHFTNLEDGLKIIKENKLYSSSNIKNNGRKTHRIEQTTGVMENATYSKKCARTFMFNKNATYYKMWEEMNVGLLFEFNIMGSLSDLVDSIFEPNIMDNRELNCYMTLDIANKYEKPYKGASNMKLYNKIKEKTEKERAENIISKPQPEILFENELSLKYLENAYIVRDCETKSEENKNLIKEIKQELKNRGIILKERKSGIIF